MYAKIQSILNKVFLFSKTQSPPLTVPLDLHKHNIGLRAEEIALIFLKEKGMTFLKKNWKCRLGEIDLIMRDKQDLVFVEVKSRCLKSRQNYDVFANITQNKTRRLRLLVDVFQAQSESIGTADKTLKLKPRIDLVGVIFENDGKTVSSIEHLISAL